VVPQKEHSLFRRAFGEPRFYIILLIAVNVALAIFSARWRTMPTKLAPLQQFTSMVDQQYHECVPLGWYPDPLGATGYIPSYNTNVASTDTAFQAYWVGVIPKNALDNHRAVAIKQVLDELTRVKMLVRRDEPEDFRYTLTHEGVRNLYEENDLGNNNEHWPYECFSRLRATNVVWATRPARDNGTFGDAITAQVRLTWVPGEVAAWATPSLRSHAVTLPPLLSPVRATAYRFRDGTWTLAQIDFDFPTIEHPAAWTLGNVLDSRIRH
jgi:hypothetical protein